MPHDRDAPATHRLSPNIVALGIVSLLMGMSSAMIHGLLPVFLVTVLGASMASVGVIEGIAEATNSLTKIVSGAVSDWMGRRKPLVFLGYGLSAITKLLFPLAAAASTVLLARTVDRIGKGIRDAPRDALLTDVTPHGGRGAGFGLRLTLYTIGAVLGPLAAIALMALSGGDFRLVFWIAAIPAFASLVVIHVGVKDPPNDRVEDRWRPPMRRSDLAELGALYWWVIMIASLLSLARFSQAFLVLKAYATGVDVALVPTVMILTHGVYAVAAYPCGVLADRIDRRVQLGVGAAILVAADVVLAAAGTLWTVALGAILWGLQMGVTQGLLATLIADAAPDHRRGTAFGIYDMIVGVTTFIASAGAGVLWVLGGSGATFGAGALVAAGAVLLLLSRPMPKAGA